MDRPLPHLPLVPCFCVATLLAETYASGEAEVVMGECVQRGIKEKLWARSDLILTTKIFFGTGKVKW